MKLKRAKGRESIFIEKDEARKLPLNKQDATPICPVASAQAIIQRRRRKPAILSKLARSRMAEGVGFEPTVGFPTLDFESSALNRAQPPFLGKKKNVGRSTSNIQHPTQVWPTDPGPRRGSRSSSPSRECRLGFAIYLGAAALADRIIWRDKKC